MPEYFNAAHWPLCFISKSRITRDLSDILAFVVEPGETISDSARWAVLQRKIQGQRIARIFGLFRSIDVEPILIKGFAADRFYPSDVFRASVDVDLAVSSADFDRASELIRTSGEEGMAIDLHRELRHLDSLRWDDLFDNSSLLEIEATMIRVLRPEDHLRVLAVHWLNDGGINLEKLWDIYYIVANRPPDFDWQRALETVTPKRRRWIVCAVLLAEKYLDLDLSGTPLELEEPGLPIWLTRSVESSWADPPREIPLWLLKGQPREFMEQLGSRLFPNPVRATIEMGGSIDAATQCFYRFGNFFQRSIPSLKRGLRIEE